MRPLGALLIVLGLIALAASRMVTVATLDVALVLIGVVLLIAGIALLVFGRSNRERREERRAQEGTPEARTYRSGSGVTPAGTGDRDLSSPVPLGPSSEAGATSGTGTSAPGPVVRSDELPAPSTASANLAPPMPAAPDMDDGANADVDRVAAERRAAGGAQQPTLDDADRRPG